MTDLPSWTVTHFLRGLVATVILHPIRSGTLRLRGHSPAVAGITVFVAFVYVFLLIGIAVARPLRAASDFVADTSRGDVSVLPSFLVPMLLFLLGLSFALVLAGSQRSHPVLRITMLAAVLAIVGSIVMVVPNRETSGSVWWIAVAGVVLTAAYSIAMWWGRTPASVDFLVLFVLLEATIAAAYRAIVLGQASSDLRFDIVTTSLLLTYLMLLASPVAFAAGLSAVGVGVAAGAWSADFVRRKTHAVTVIVLVVLVGAWQSWIVISNAREGLAQDPSAHLRQLVAALVVAAIGWAIWFLLAGNRVASIPEPTGDSSGGDEVGDLVAVAGRFGLPIGYGLQSAVVATALLSMVVVGAASLAPDTSTSAIQSLIETMTTQNAVTLTRWAVVVGLIAATTVLARRGRLVPAAIAAVDAVVVGSLILTSKDAWFSAWSWTPADFGDIGVLTCAALAVYWTVTRRWVTDRAGLLLLILLMSALIRQAAILEVPLGFLISASAAGVLIFGLFWSFLTGGSATHEDSAHATRDRRLLLFLGESLYAIAIVAWAVIGKQTEASGALSQIAALAVLTLGTSLVLLMVYQQVRSARVAAGSATELPPVGAS